MASNNSLNLVDLDFDSLKTSFKNYLRNQQQFKDYDFDSSNMSVLLDLLAYNTYKNSFFINMAISESFLDSAQLTSSVLSHSKELNYLPRSSRSAKARVRVTFTVDNPENQPYVIQKGNLFSTLVKNTAYSFSIPETITVSSPNTEFSFETDIYEGVYVQDSYIFDSRNERPRFKLTNKNADITSLNVIVFEDNEEVGTIYNSTKTLLDLNEISKVYFLQATENGYYEIYFGDGTIGRKPKQNATVLLEYRLSNGILPNSARIFSCGFDPTGGLDNYKDIVTTTLQVAMGGSSEEDLESIRYYAPRNFQIQERTVTASDYEIALKMQFPEINAVSVYGGETVIPPQYGKVFVAVDISDVDGIPNSKKTEYYSFLKKRSPLSIEPIFVDPDFLYLYVDSKIRYDIGVSKLTPERIKTLVADTIKNYNENYLDDFNSTLRYSQLVSDINDAETSIVSNITEVTAYKKINPELGVSQNIDIKYNIALRNDLPNQIDIHPIEDVHAVESSTFIYAGFTCQLEDDGNGIVRIMRFEKDKMIKVLDVGTVDYASGFIQLKNFNIALYEGDSIRVYVRPADIDISTQKNTILTIEPSAINISIQTV